MIRLDRDAQERLLGRRLRRVLTPENRRTFTGQRVVVTGAGGSIGAELCRQLAACVPDTLTIVDHAEYNLFRIESELREHFPSLSLDVCLGDVSRRADIASLCKAARPNTVFHAAAYKHVTMTERAVVAAARTNIIGTAETARAAKAAGARMVLVSSDKAADPRSVMGATKRMAELVALAAAGAKPNVVAVRFGNILGSSGSVVEIMLACIREGRAIPITHEAATRFFMSGDEAVALVLKASLIGCGGEVFWLDMGDPVRISDLAQRVIEWATPAGTPQVGIDVIGLRPGEKLREDLTTQGLAMRRTEDARIWTARQASLNVAAIHEATTVVRQAVTRGDAASTLSAVLDAVPEFVPSDAALAAAGLIRRTLAKTA